MNLQENIRRIRVLMGEAVEDESFEISYDVDPKIKDLQNFLTSKKYYIGKFGPNKDGVDGKYGPFTKAAHEAFKAGMKPEVFNNRREQIAQKYIGDVKDETLSKEFNFHLIPDGKNNYRSAQIPVTLNGKDYLSELIDKYRIKTIIRFNGDGRDSRHYSTHPMTTIQSEKNLAESKGVKFFKLSSTKDQDKVNSLLSQGNVLIHCAHGADRTGGNVGGYLYQNGWGDTKKIWDYTTNYNGWNRMLMSNPKLFVMTGFLPQAQKFGVKDLEQAIDLANNKKTITKGKNTISQGKNIIIGDSQVPYVDMNTTKASRLTKSGGIDGLWEGGKTVSWLTDAVSQYPKSNDVSNVIIVIGTNGGFGKFTKDDIPRLFSVLKSKFPNANFYVVQGSWGWGGLKNITEKEVRNYYKQFKQQGATLIEPPIGKIEPHSNHPIYQSIGSSIDGML
jgi:protein tyrosine/serine phosphatase